MLNLTPGWSIECERCANEAFSDEEDREQAHVDLRLRGWTRGARTLCPQCSAEIPPLRNVVRA